MSEFFYRENVFALVGKGEIAKCKKWDLYFN
jgi:hypothetical protein